MTRNLVQLEIDTLNLRATLQDLATAIDAQFGDTSEAQAKAAEMIVLAVKLADALADAQEGMPADRVA